MGRMRSEQTANAQLIVKAVNSHQSLVDLLEGLMEEIDAYIDPDAVYGLGPGGEDLPTSLSKQMKAAKSLLDSLKP